MGSASSPEPTRQSQPFVTNNVTSPLVAKQSEAPLGWYASAGLHVIRMGPVRVVQCQLGHATPSLTLGLYGAFLPSADDRATWRAQVTSHEAKRRGMGEL
jgi:hypothetical protein